MSQIVLVARTGSRWARKLPGTLWRACTDRRSHMEDVGYATRGLRDAECAASRRGAVVRPDSRRGGRGAGRDRLAARLHVLRYGFANSVTPPKRRRLLGSTTAPKPGYRFGESAAANGFSELRQTTRLARMAAHDSSPQERLSIWLRSVKRPACTASSSLPSARVAGATSIRPALIPASAPSSMVGSRRPGRALRGSRTGSWGRTSLVRSERRLHRSGT